MALEHTGHGVETLLASWILDQPVFQSHHGSVKNNELKILLFPILLRFLYLYLFSKDRALEVARDSLEGLRNYPLESLDGISSLKLI